MPPSSPSLAGVESLVVAAGLLGFGYLLADAILGRKEVDRAIRWALALPALAGFAFLLMLLHVVTRGHVLENAWLVRGITVAAAGSLIAWRVRTRPSRPGTDRRTTWVIGALLGLALVLWGTPVFRMLPLHFEGDTIWHAGWTSQLLAGSPTPRALVTGDVPNYYPWLFHGLLGLVARFTPGGRAFHALGPMHLLQVAGAVLALFALGREVGRRVSAGVGTAVFGALAGGFGFFLLERADVVVNPRLDALRYGGDLLFARPFNVSFTNLAPAFPRDLAFALLFGFLLLLVLGVRERNVFLLASAGVILGLIGLTGGESFFVGAAIGAFLPLATVGRRGRAVATAAVLVPAVVLVSVWAVPLVLSYARLGGFVDTAASGTVDLPAWAILVSWGIATPFALYGAARWVPRARDNPGALLVLALTVLAGSILALSAAVPGVLGEAFETIGRRHRYWPLLHLGVALYAGLGFSDLTHRLRRLSPAGGLAIGGTALLFAIPSPLLASIAVPDRLAPPPELEAALTGDSSALPAVLARLGEEPCVVAAPRPLTPTLFASTGYRFVAARPSRGHAGNASRIRWRDIYERIPPDAERSFDNRRLITGDVLTPAVWQDLVRKYDVDAVVVPARFVTAESFARLEGERGVTEESQFVVFRVGSCETT